MTYFTQLTTTSGLEFTLIPKLKFQISLRQFLVFLTISALLTPILFSNNIYNVYSFLTGSPISWLKHSSPLKPYLADVWSFRFDPNLEQRQSFLDLKQLINNEISQASTKTEIENHIKRHFKSPNFSASGFFSTQWNQFAHGYPDFPYFTSNIVTIIYHVHEDKFLYAELSTGFSADRIDLTQPVDLWDFSESSWRNE